MTNDLTTVEGSLQEVIDRLETNLAAKGVNASYSASTGILGLVDEIQNISQSSGGSGVPCYKVEFTSKSLTYSDWNFSTNGHMAVLEVYLQYQYAPYSGGVVTLSDGTNTYTATTDSNGKATFNPPITENSTTFTASYTNTTDTITVTKSNFLYVDACNSSSNLSNYGSSVMMYRGSSKTGNPASTISYNSTMNAYDFHATNTSTSYFSMIPITASSLASKTNYVAEVMLYTNANYSNAEVGVYVRDEQMTDSTEGFGSTMMNYNNRLYGRKLKVTQSTANNTINLESGATPYQHWYKVKLYVTDSRIDAEWYDANGNQLYDRFGIALSISNKQFGLLMKGGTVANSTAYVKNIKVRSTATS